MTAGLQRCACSITKPAVGVNLCLPPLEDCVYPQRYHTACPRVDTEVDPYEKIIPNIHGFLAMNGNMAAGLHINTGYIKY